MKNKIHYCYTIFYIERKYMDNIDKDIKDHNYKHIRAIIPMVTILKKSTSRGKKIYSNEPVLFNYGFIKMPKDKALSRDFLRKLKRDIPAIRGFLKNTETLHPRKKKSRIDNMDIFDDFSIVATCPWEDVRRFLKISRENKKFSVDDLVSIKPGDYVILKGYPFEGIDATIEDIDYKKNKVKLLLYPQNGKMELWLDFDQVLYSVYQNYNPRLLYSDQNDENITDDKIKDILKLHQI